MTYSSALFTEAGAPVAAPPPGAGPQDRPAARPPGSAPAHGCSRSAPAGASWPSGPPPRRARYAPSPFPGSSSPRRPQRRPGRAADRVERRAPRLPRRRRRVTTPSCSVEMLEAVGERYWDAYFRPSTGGWPRGADRAAGHSHAHDRMLATRHLYLDPQVHLSRRTAPVDRGDRSRPPASGCGSPSQHFGAHYATTLQSWRERFGPQRARWTPWASTAL